MKLGALGANQLLYSVIFCRRWDKCQRVATHLLKHIVQLLQGRAHGPVAAHAACIAVEVDVGHPIQGVVTEGADHRGPHRPPGLLVVGGFIQVGVVCSIDMLLPARLMFIHHKSWKIFFYSVIQRYAKTPKLPLRVSLFLRYHLG